MRILDHLVMVKSPSSHAQNRHCGAFQKTLYAFTIIGVNMRGFSMFITLDDTKIFAAAFGSKNLPPILALGGWIGSWEDWIEPLAILSDNWRVIAYDHRGSGVTISPVETITFDRMINDVFVVMDAFGVERCVLAAMSMGAAVALGAALRHPERISGLVLVDSLDLREKSTDGDDLFLMGLTHDYARTLDGFINACVPEKDSDHIKRWGRHILDRASQESAIALYKMSKTLPIRDQLNRITQRTLIIHGDADQIAPIESAQWLAETIPQSTLKIINGAGHVPIMTRPDDVAREIQSFYHVQVT
jgi:pimeloyl-ACP methyl ester carboxylesterase